MRERRRSKNLARRMYHDVQSTIEKLLTQTPMDCTLTISELSKTTGATWAFNKKCLEIIKLIQDSPFKFIFEMKGGFNYERRYIKRVIKENKKQEKSE